MLENQSIDWDVLLPALRSKRCVLFLGPDAYPFSETLTVEQAMWAATTADADVVRKFYPDDGLVLFQKKSNRVSSSSRCSNFLTPRNRTGP